MSDQNVLMQNYPCEVKCSTIEMTVGRIILWFIIVLLIIWLIFWIAAPTYVQTINVLGVPSGLVSPGKSFVAALIVTVIIFFIFALVWIITRG
jgi:hypothetical protein